MTVLRCFWKNRFYVWLVDYVIREDRLDFAMLNLTDFLDGAMIWEGGSGDMSVRR